MRPNLKMTVFASLTALALASSGCNGAATGPMMNTPDSPDAPNTNNPDSPNNPSNPNNPQPAPTAKYSGVYEVVAPLDFTQNGVLPGVWGPVLSATSKLNQKPGVAILELLEGTNIPYLSDILAAIPDFLVAGLGAIGAGWLVRHSYMFAAFAAFLGVSVWLLWRTGRPRGELRAFRLALASAVFAVLTFWLSLVGIFPFMW